jgi:hypothetical protein
MFNLIGQTKEGLAHGSGEITYKGKIIHLYISGTATLFCSLNSQLGVFLRTSKHLCIRRVFMENPVHLAEHRHPGN